MMALRLLAVALLAGCARAPLEIHPAVVALQHTPLAPFAKKKALVIGLDGLRPDALLAAAPPNLLGLAAAGAATFEAQSVVPTWSAP